MGPPPVSQGAPMRNDNELVYVTVRAGRVVLERPMDAAPADRRRRSYSGGQQFITTRERAKSLAVDVDGPVVAPPQDDSESEADAPGSTEVPELGAGTGDAVATQETAPVDAPAVADPADGPAASDAEASAAGADKGEDEGEDEGEGDEDDEDDESEQDPNKPRTRRRRGGHNRLYRGGHDRAV